MCWDCLWPNSVNTPKSSTGFADVFTLIFFLEQLSRASLNQHSPFCCTWTVYTTYVRFFYFFLSRSGKLPVLYLLTGQKSGFSPRRGDSLHRFTSNLARPTGTWVRLAAQNFISLGTRGGNAAPKYEKFQLFGKELHRRGEPFDRFLKFLRDFIRPTILHSHFKFDMLRNRASVNYVDFFRAPCRNNCAFGRKMICTFLMVSTCSITMQSLG